MEYERCELCGKKKRDVKVGQCTRCHADTCDEDWKDCPAKIKLMKQDPWMRFIYSD